jgi:hypothetical protein
MLVLGVGAVGQEELEQQRLVNQMPERVGRGQLALYPAHLPDMLVAVVAARTLVILRLVVAVLVAVAVAAAVAGSATPTVWRALPTPGAVVVVRAAIQALLALPVVPVS